MHSTTTRIAAVANYDNLDSIKGFVRRVLCQNARVAESLSAPDRFVIVKPNWVQQSHEYRPNVWLPVITHPSVVVAVVETLAEFMSGRGAICICDAPHTYADFDAIVSRGGLRDRLDGIRARWPKLDLKMLDLRREIWRRKEEVTVERRMNDGDPRGYARLDLGRDSLFYRHHGEGRFYGADFETAVVNSHHQGEIQEYLIAGSPIACDLFVNVPKLKTHKKTGLTCCLKNLVGINGDKNWLPHHTGGTPRDQGDEFPDVKWSTVLESNIKRIGHKLMANVPIAGNWVYRKLRNTGKRVLGNSEFVVRNGNWHGNDTCWRMALDLNRALLYGNLDGTWSDWPNAKHYLCIVDGIVGGEGNGPIAPDAVHAGILIGGTNPAEVDATACRVMGFEPKQIPIVSNAFAPHRWPIGLGSLEALKVSDERTGELLCINNLDPAVPGGFRPHFGWQALQRCA
jgi:uncharacterized protein (DUF362 family)